MFYLGIKLETKKTNMKIHIVQEDPDVMDLKRKFKKLFHENKMIKGMEVDIQINPDAKLIQQKGRPKPIHLQPTVGKEIEKSKKNGHIEQATNINENCYFQSSSNYLEKKIKRLKLL